MADLEQFEFTVPGYTPDTMPLDRLIEYLEQLMIILGHKSDMHLVGIEKSSTKPLIVMNHQTAHDAKKRAREVWQGGGPKTSQQAFKRIRHMVSEDGGKSATLQTRGAKILEFPKMDLGEDQIVSAVRQPTTVTGTLVRIGGIAENAQLLIQEFTGNVIAGCTAPRALAQQMGALIYKPIQVHGIGSWARNAKGSWEISRLHIQNFEPMRDEKFEDLLPEIEASTANWPDDIHSRLLSMREHA